MGQQQGMRSGDLECSPHMYKRTVKKKQDRRGRFRTQPVTFMEIKEVDEEKVGPADGVEREQLGLVGQREVFEHARPQDEVGRGPDEVPLGQEAAIWIEGKVGYS